MRWDEHCDDVKDQVREAVLMTALFPIDELYTRRWKAVSQNPMFECDEGGVEAATYVVGAIYSHADMQIAECR